MGIRNSGLLVHSALIIDTIYKLNNILSGSNWMITGNIANQLWVYLLAGNCIYCRPTDNIDIRGVNIMKKIEDSFKVIAEGFEDDLVRRISFLVSHSPRLKINVESYLSPKFVDELDRSKKIPFQKQMVPVISLEDLILTKLALGRDIDFIDITSLFRAYKRYLRANIINNEKNPPYIIHFSEIMELANKLYVDIADEIYDSIENITSSNINELVRNEDNPRKLIRLINL